MRPINNLAAVLVLYTAIIIWASPLQAAENERGSRPQEAHTLSPASEQAAAAPQSRAISACSAAAEVGKFPKVEMSPTYSGEGAAVIAPEKPALISIEDLQALCVTMKEGCMTNCDGDADCQTACNLMVMEDNCTQAMNTCRSAAELTYNTIFSGTGCVWTWTKLYGSRKVNNNTCYPAVNQAANQAFNDCISQVYLKACQAERDVFEKKIIGCVKEGNGATPRAECQKRILACEKDETSSPYCTFFGTPPRDGWMQIRSPFLAKESKEVSGAGAQLQALGKDITKDFSDAVKVSEEIQKGQAPSREGIEAMYYGSVIENESQKRSIDTAITELRAAATARAAAASALEKATTDEERAAAQESLNKANQDLTAADQKMKALRPSGEGQSQ